MKNEYLTNTLREHTFFSSSLFALGHFFHLYSKYTASGLQWERFYWKLRKKLIKKITYHPNNNLEINKTIWFFWYQGLENAPSIVKTCFTSIINHCPDWKIVVLDSKNLPNYIHLPDQIIKLWQHNKISFAGFSDLVRCYLLSNYGGLWLDSTCLLLKEIPAYIADKDLFLIKSGYYDRGVPNNQRWLIYCKKGNEFMKSAYAAMITAVEKYKCFPHYFLIMIIFQICSSVYSGEWKESGDINELNCYIFQKYLNMPKNNCIINEAYDVSFVQKLTYKGVNEDKKDTIYKWIIQTRF
jgi:mannosyltransferase OCH1-like enzyme